MSLQKRKLPIAGQKSDMAEMNFDSRKALNTLYCDEVVSLNAMQLFCYTLSILIMSLLYLLFCITAFINEYEHSLPISIIIVR